MAGESNKEIREMQEVFLQEASELLQKIEETLLKDGKVGPDDVRELFRCFHTIKGSAGVFGYGHVGRYAHNIESLLEEKREAGSGLDEALREFLLRVKDRLETLFSISEEFYSDSDEQQDIDLHFFEEASRFSESTKAFDFPESNAGLQNDEEPMEPIRSTWHIRLFPERDFFRCGFDFAPILSYIKKHGEISDLEMHPENVPASGEYDPADCYFTPEFNLLTSDTYEEILGYFSHIPDALTATVEKNDSSDLGLESITTFSQPTQVTGKNTDISELTAETDPRGALNMGSTVRIDASRIDQLLNLVGELVVAGVQMGQAVDVGENPESAESLDHLSRTISDVRESAMRLRMIPVGQGFRRFKRLVHDLSRDLGKPVLFHLEGEDTELDRTVVEKIMDPMVHILRNAMDHGIESKEERKAANKKEIGTIRIHAYHSTGEVIVDIEDDGRGISREKVKKKAEELGIIKSAQGADVYDPLNLIFEPGLSTASSLTNVSGRGVGMDVVRRNIEALRGSVEVHSSESRGTLFRIRLPLTLATIDGLHVETGGVHSVISLDQVVECFEYTESLRDSDMITIRGESVPCIDMNRLLGLPEENNDRRFVVIAASGGRKAGLVVNQLNGQIQSVVRPLRGFFEGVSEYSGFTLLGDGSIAMILHVPGIIESYSTKKRNGELQLIGRGISENS